MEENTGVDHPLVGKDDSNVVVLMPATAVASTTTATGSSGNGTSGGGGGAMVSFQSANSQTRASPAVGENIRNGISNNGNSNNGNNGSQNNLCNGSLIPGSLSGHGLVRKVQNHSPNAQKKNLVTLTHLPKRPPVTISFTDISYSVSEGRSRGFKTIVKAVNGTCRSGELTAIMGPSGAGKSTLMNILAGYKTSHLSGTVNINGKERNLRRFRKLSCYIMQDDRLMPYLSVREAMMVSANLKLGGDMKMSAKKIVVEEILEALGLIESSNTKTLNLSGGQRKRLSIALELVNNPPVMFFDEPTSGLDSSSCFQLISLLKSLARGGRTIVCTIHQPSARLFEMFDHLYMLAEGQCMYQGRVEGLVPYLGSLGYECPSYHNPADYVMEVASGEFGEAVHKLVMAVSSGKCQPYNYPTESDIRHSSSVVVANGSTAITNDISKTPSSNHNHQHHSHLHHHTISSTSSSSVAANASSANTTGRSNSPVPSSIIAGIATTSLNGPSTSDDLSPSEFTKLKQSSATNDTVIQMPPNNEDSTTMLRKKGGNGGGAMMVAGVTTSLLDSNESVVTLPNKGGFPTSGLAQFWILLKRAFVTIVRDHQLTQMRLVSHVVVGAIIGMIYYDIGNEASKVTSNAGCIFFTTLFTMFTAMMPTILTFPMEMAVFIREHLNYWYSLKAFYFAKTLADLPFQILFSSVYVIVVYYLTSQPMEAKRMAMFVFICILTSLVAQSLGLLIGAGLSVEAGVFLGPVSTIPTILFSGFFVNFDTIPGYLQWVTYVSYVRYAFEGAMVAIYGMDREKLKCSEMYCHFRNPKKFLEDMSMDKSEYWIDAVALIAIFIVLRVIAYFVLRWKVHSIR